MKIAIIGPGRIGSTFAFYLSRAKHEVTVIARGARLEALTRDAAIVAVDGERASVSVFLAISEGLPQTSVKMRAQFFVRAKASLCEVVSALDLARELGALASRMASCAIKPSARASACSSPSAKDCLRRA